MQTARPKAIDLYIQRSFHNVVKICPFFTLLAAITVIVLRLLGYYADVSVLGLAALTASCIIYCLIGIFISRNCHDSEGQLKPSYLLNGKRFLVISMILQWNFITYLTPSSEFWAYAPFFVIPMIYFFDVKAVLVEIIGLLVSLAISWFIIPDKLLPPQTQQFLPDMVFRITFLSMMMFSLYTLTFFVRKLCLDEISDQLVSEAEKESLVDTLTGVNNSKAFTMACEAVDSTQTLGAIIMNVNGLKYVRTGFGQEAGDNLIVASAAILKRHLRISEIFRVTDEEFIVLCRNISGDMFDSRVKALEAELRAQPVPVASVGYVYGGDSLQSMLTKAEREMYNNKEAYYKRFPDRRM